MRRRSVAVIGPCHGAAGAGRGRPAGPGYRGSASATANSTLPTLSSPVFGHRAAAAPAPPPSGRISSPGGPYLYDSSGRVVFFHGVDAVYKYAPYELYPDKGKPWNLSVADASLMARLGFNVVRLGMTWSGLEPGTARANDPAICAHGAPAIRTSSTRPC